MSAIIGALRAVLSLDSAAFEEGATAAEKSSARMQRNFGAVARKFQSVGKTMSLAITAPLTAISASVLGAANSLADLDRAADVAGISAERLKVLSMASRDLGVEQDQLADILKDVNEKFGEAVATGGGPLLDFFKNIAPQVGLTTESFKGLASDQALQLYISSLEKAGLTQQEMTFYMEALASESTRLIPLFAQNGTAISQMEAEAKRLGLSIDSGLVESARAVDRQFRITSEVLGVQMQQALVALAPAISALVQALVPAIQKIAEVVQTAAEWFGHLSPEVQTALGAMGGLAAVAGPLAVAIGAVVPSLGLVTQAMVALGAVMLANPIGLTVTAIAGGAALIIAYWDDIVPFFSNMLASVASAFSQGWASVEATVSQAWAAIWAEVSSWPAQMVEAGANIVEGLKQGIAAKIDEVRSWFADKGGRLLADFKAVFNIRSPSRVMREIGQFIAEGLGLGLQDGVPQVEAAMGKVKDAVGSKGLTGELSSFGEAAKAIFTSVATGAQKMGEAISQAISSWASSKASDLAGAAFDTLFGALFKSGSAASSAVKGMAAAVPGVAAGAKAFASASGEGFAKQAAIGSLGGASLGASALAAPVFYITVPGATGNAEVERMVRAGVSGALAEYDRQILPRRVAVISRDARRVGA